MKAISRSFGTSTSAFLHRAFRTVYEHTLFRFYQASLQWVSVEDLPDVERVFLGEGEVVSLPEAGDVPFLTDARRPDGTLALPAPEAAVLHDVFYSPHYQIPFLSRHRVLADSINDRYPFAIEPQLLYGPEVSFLPGCTTSLRGRWNNHYHTLVDVFPRLELLHQPYFTQFDEILLLCPGGLRPLERYLLDRLPLPSHVRLVEVDEDRLYRSEQYVHVSYPTTVYCGYLPGWYRRRVRERLLPDRPSRRTHRILISRRRAGKRRILNMDELADALEPLGFTTYELEALSIPEQIELFYDADVVVGAHGAGLTNVLFCDRARIVELFPAWYVLPHYYYLSLSLGHSYRYCVTEEIGPAAREERREHVLDDLATYNDAHFRVDVAGVIDRLRELDVG